MLLHSQAFQLLSALSIQFFKFLPVKPLLQSCLSFAYAVYVGYPCEIFALASQKVEVLLRVTCRRSNVVRRLLMHTLCLYEIAIKLLQDLLKSSPRDMLIWLMQTVAYVWNNPQRVAHASGDLHWSDFVDVLDYEEQAEVSTCCTLLTKLILSHPLLLQDIIPGHMRRRMERMMHHSVPANKFRATVRSRKSDASQQSVESADEGDVCTPVSFPPTPYSRARVMLRSTERVESIMYAARDRLRLEELTRHDDSITRERASELQQQGQLAVFDPYHTSEGIALSCGSHCAFKVGRAMCCSTKAMVAVKKECFVYAEFVVNVQVGVTPALVVGLSPPDCPLNVMVGSWPRSIGLYSEGQLLVGSTWFSTMQRKPWEAGTTVGMLTFIRDPNAPHSFSEALGKAAEEMRVLAETGQLRTQSSSSPRAHVRFSGEEVLSGSEQQTPTPSRPILSLQSLFSLFGSRRSTAARSTTSHRTGYAPPPSPTTPPESEVPSIHGASAPWERAAEGFAEQTGPDAGAGCRSTARRASTSTGSHEEPSTIEPLRQTDDGGESCTVTISPEGYLPTQSADNLLPRPVNFFCRFSVNGQPVEVPREASIASNDVTNLNAPLTPTVSILSSDTRVRSTTIRI
jgi:hypothetical protein